MISILFVSATISFFRGFIKEVLTIIGIVGALAAALLWGNDIAPFFHGWLEPLAEGERQLIFGILPLKITSTICSYLSLFLMTFIVLAVISHYIGKMVQDMGLNAVDRSMGFLFGLARGFILLGVAFIIVTWLDVKDRPEWLTKAKMTPILLDTADILKDIIPEDKLGSIAKERIDELRRKKEDDPSKETSAPKDEKANDAANDADSLIKQKDLEKLMPDKGNGYDAIERKALDQLFKQTEP